MLKIEDQKLLLKAGVACGDVSAPGRWDTQSTGREWRDLRTGTEDLQGAGV